ncbi:hypothetical protein BH09BAC1_BH09BAC1_22160 [soil metagenome]
MSANSNLNTRKHLIKLRETLAEIGLEGELHETDANFATDVLVIPLDDEEEDGDILAFAYLPGTEEYYTNICILQLMLEFPIELNPEHKPALETLLLRMNQQLGIGAYYIDEEDCIGIRHIITHSINGSIEKAVLEDTINLLLSMYHYTFEGIEEVNDGADAGEVLEDLFG